MTEPSSSLKKTPLHALHVKLGGRMVEFGGYDMPIQYPEGIMAEHNWTRAHAGLFDVSHMGPSFLALPELGGGEDAHRKISAIVEKLVPSDIAGLAPGKVQLTVLLNEDGGIIDDLMAGHDHLKAGARKPAYIIEEPMAAVEPFAKAGYDMNAAAILLCESDGTPEEVADEIARVTAVLETLCGTSISSTEVSRVAAQLDPLLEQWRIRPPDPMRYLFMDARYEKVRGGGAVRSCAVLMAIGIREVDGRRVILGTSVSLSEAEVHWRGFLQSLRERGIGTPALTTRGFKDEEARITANLIADVLDNPRDAANIDAVRAKVNALTARFPVYR